MSIEGTAPEVVTRRPRGRLAITTNVFLRFSQLFCTVAVFVAMTYMTRGIAAPYAAAPRWVMFSRIVAGIAVMYAFTVMVVAGSMGTGGRWALLCGLLDTFFMTAFVTMTVLMRVTFSCQGSQVDSIVDSGLCSAWIPSVVASALAGVSFFVALPMQLYANSYGRTERPPDEEGGPDTVTLTLAGKTPLWKWVLPCPRCWKPRRSRRTSRVGPSLSKAATLPPRAAATDPSPANGARLARPTPLRRHPPRVTIWDRLSAQPVAEAGPRSLGDVSQQVPGAWRSSTPGGISKKAVGQESRKGRGTAKRPRLSRSSGSMARPGGLHPPPGIPYY